jgi:hypothetical protein
MDAARFLSGHDYDISLGWVGPTASMVLSAGADFGNGDALVDSDGAEVGLMSPEFSLRPAEPLMKGRGADSHAGSSGLFRMHP